MIELDTINRIVLKLNELEDSKFGQNTEKRVELADRQIPLFKQLYAQVGGIICQW